MYCWGKLTPWPEGFQGEPTRIPMPVPLVSVASASRMFVGGTSCGLSAQGTAYCWHSGLAPLPVPGRHRFAGLTGGHGKFCGFTPGGSVFCWQWLGTEVGSETRWVLCQQLDADPPR